MLYSEKKISINGLGEEKLDFTYIQDLIQGITKSILNEKAYNQIFNITYGNGRRILDLIEILKNNFNKIEVEFKDRSKLVPIRGTLSNLKSQELLGYKSEWSLEKGYQKYIDWYKNFFRRILMLIKDQWLSKVTGIKCYNVKSINFLSNQQKIKPKTLITYKKIKKF